MSLSRALFALAVSLPMLAPDVTAPAHALPLAPPQAAMATRVQFFSDRMPYFEDDEPLSPGEIARIARRAGFTPAGRVRFANDVVILPARDRYGESVSLVMDPWDGTILDVRLAHRDTPRPAKPKPQPRPQAKDKPALSVAPTPAPKPIDTVKPGNPDTAKPVTPPQPAPPAAPEPPAAKLEPPAKVRLPAPRVEPLAPQKSAPSPTPAGTPAPSAPVEAPKAADATPGTGTQEHPRIVGPAPPAYVPQQQ